MLIIGLTENGDSLPRYSHQLLQLVSEALTRENKFWFSAVFAICQIIPLENDGYVANAWTI